LFATSATFENSNFELRPHLRSPSNSASEFDKAAKEITLEPSYTKISDIRIAIIKAALIGVIEFLMFLTLALDQVFLEFSHKLGQSLIDDWLELEVLPEDEGCELMVVMDEVHKTKGNVVSGIVKGVSGSLFVLFDSLLVPEFLDECRELPFYIIPQSVLRHTGQPI